MQTARVIPLERARRAVTERPETFGYGDNRQALWRRMERWLRLQQFVYGLPDDYSYSVRTREEGGVIDCYTLVKSGWMTWYGHGRALDSQEALALALRETGEAISANVYRIAFYSCARRVRALWSRLRRRTKSNEPGEVEIAELMAG